jgi:hypothetical protein
VKAKKDQEVDDNEIPDLQVEVAGHMVEQEEVVVVLVTEAGVQSVKGGQEEQGRGRGRLVPEDNAEQRVANHEEQLQVFSNKRFMIFSLQPISML